MDPARGPGSPHDQGSGFAGNDELDQANRPGRPEEQAGRLHDD